GILRARHPWRPETGWRMGFHVVTNTRKTIRVPKLLNFPAESYQGLERFPAIVTVRIKTHSGYIPHVRIQIQRLWIGEGSIRNRDRRCTPVRRNETSEPVRVITRPEVIQPSLDVSLVSAEQIVVLIIADKLQLAAPGIEVRLLRDVPLGVGDNVGGLQMIREV